MRIFSRRGLMFQFGGIVDVFRIARDALPNRCRMPSLPMDEPSSRVRSLPDGLRTDRRYPCIVTPVSIHSSAHPEPFDGFVLEVSKSGLRVRSARALPPGVQVRISFAGPSAKTIIDAESRFCNSVEGGTFEIGLEIMDSREP